MSHGDLGSDATPRPATKKPLLWLAGLLLVIPVVALMWTSSYARETPRLGDFPFFFWYQMAWVPVTALMTYAAYRLVLAARGQRPGDEKTLGDRESDR